MQKLFKFLLFGLIFTVLQITNVGAQTPAAPEDSVAPTGTPGMPPTGMAPTGTPESGGISSWIKGGLKALGIGSEPEMGNISHCAEFSGPPKVACEAAAAGN